MLSFTVPVQDTSPGIFTATQNGTGQGAILNAGLAASTYNSADNPAERLSTIVMFATGSAARSSPVPDGQLSLAASSLTLPPDPLICGFKPSCRRPTTPVLLTVGGKPARILYAGAAPYQPWSMLQINAVVPADVDSGVQPVVLTIGQNDNAQQKVTIAVK